METLHYYYVGTTEKQDGLGKLVLFGVFLTLWEYVLVMEHTLFVTCPLSFSGQVADGTNDVESYQSTIVKLQSYEKKKKKSGCFHIFV